MKENLLIIAALLAGILAVVGLFVGVSVTQAPLTTVDLDRGEQLFSQRCSTCHSVDNDQMASYGPNLSGIGEEAGTRIGSMGAEEYLLQSIVTPEAFRSPGQSGVMPMMVEQFGLAMTNAKLTSLTWETCQLYPTLMFILSHHL